jgi:hypothetical protein
MQNSSRPEDALKPQARQVLSMLRGRGERGVTNGDFIRSYIERFGGRICEMRKLGWEIETVREGQGKSRYFLRAEPVGVGAGDLGPVGVSTDSGGSKPDRPESDSLAAVGLGGPEVGSADDGQLFDPNLLAINFGNSERAA